MRCRDVRSSRRLVKFEFFIFWFFLFFGVFVVTIDVKFIVGDFPSSSPVGVLTEHKVRSLPSYSASSRAKE